MPKPFLLETLPVFKTERAVKPTAWQVRFLRRSVSGIPLPQWAFDLRERFRRRERDSSMTVHEGPCAAPLCSARAAHLVAIDSHNGLTPDESRVMDALCGAANAFGALPVQHPAELGEFVAAIHRCQDMLAVRIARRTYPGGWPDKGGQVDE